MSRNLRMAERIEAAPARSPLSFVVAGDSGAWPDPTADAIFAQLLRQTAALRPAPVFFANLGDFAGPGTRERHEHYLRLVDDLPVPDVCVVGNHDLDAPGAAETWADVHGPANFTFAHGHTRFVALDAAPAETPRGTAGPGEEALAFLARTLEAAPEPHRVVLLHPPPRFGARYDPHPEWGFEVGEQAFLDLVRRHDVQLVCSAHALLFDHHVHDGTRFVVSGGGGTALCSHLRGVCAAGDGPPEDRGALFHAVQITIAEDGAISGRVHQAFGEVRLAFGA
jgi:3',5'-cyclic AMP phosphodiesterase CpdA